MFGWKRTHETATVGGVTYDVTELRKAVLDECYAMALNVSEAALPDAFDAENASPTELIRIAREYGVRLSRYEV